MRNLALLLASLGIVACVSPPASPWEISVQFERSVPLLDGRATVAVRQDGIDPPKVILNVQCEGENRTLALGERGVTPEVCGLQFRFDGYDFRNAEPQAANFVVTWDEPAEGSAE